MSDSLWPLELQHSRPPCPSPTPGACSNSCPWSRWCHPTILSSVVVFSSGLKTFPASGSFLMSQLFASDDQNIGASASVLPMNIQDWFPLGFTGLIALQSKGLSRVFSNCFAWIQLDQPSFSGGSDGKKSACNVGDPGSIPGSGRSPGEGNGNPLQYSCLENHMDKRAWRAIVHGVAKGQTQVSNWKATCSSSK